MSDASTRQAVECPICGDEFDPTVAGGWCTNTECGEWQYTEGSKDAEASGQAAAESSDDAFVSPAEGDGTETEAADLFTETDGEEADEADDEASEPVDEPAGADEHDEAADADAVDDEESADDAEPEAAADADEAGTIDCPDCDAELEAEANFCVECGADVSDVSPGHSELDACPGCGADVEPEDNFCVDCGEDLAAHRAGDAPEDAVDAPAESDDGEGVTETLVLEVEGREIHVDDGDTVGREIRAALTEAGRPDDEAVRIHREHVRFVRESGSFYLLDLGDNPTQLNGDSLQKGDREQVGPGDELELSGVASVTVQAP